MAEGTKWIGKMSNWSDPRNWTNGVPQTPAEVASAFGPLVTVPLLIEDPMTAHKDSGLRCLVNHKGQPPCWHCAVCNRWIRPEDMQGGCAPRPPEPANSPNRPA